MDEHHGRRDVETLPLVEERPCGRRREWMDVRAASVHPLSEGIARIEKVRPSTPRPTQGGRELFV